MLKLAVIYSGEPRTFDKAIKKHLAFLKGFKIDTYHSIWTKTSELDLTKIKLDKNLKSLVKVPYEVPPTIDIAKFEIDILNKFKDHPIFMLGRIQYLLNSAYQEVIKSGIEYDYIVRLRYDFTYDGRLKDYIYIAKNESTIGGISNLRHLPNSMWDGFAFGEPKVMEVYFNFYKWLLPSLSDKIILKHKFQPEFALHYYLKTNKLNISLLDIKQTQINNVNREVHLTNRALQYYKDLATFYPEHYTHTNNVLTIKNDTHIKDESIIHILKKEGLECLEI